MKPFANRFDCCAAFGNNRPKHHGLFVNFGGGTEDSDLILVDVPAPGEEGKDCFTEVVVVVFDETVECCVDIKYLFLDSMGDVL
jgi:hypothetical protein